MKPKVIQGFIREDSDGQYITNGKDCFRDGFRVTRFSNGDYVTMIVTDEEFPKDAPVEFPDEIKMHDRGHVQDHSLIYEIGCTLNLILRSLRAKEIK